MKTNTNLGRGRGFWLLGCTQLRSACRGHPSTASWSACESSCQRVQLGCRGGKGSRQQWCTCDCPQLKWFDRTQASHLEWKSKGWVTRIGDNWNRTYVGSKGWGGRGERGHGRTHSQRCRAERLSCKHELRLPMNRLQRTSIHSLVELRRNANYLSKATCSVLAFELKLTSTHHAPTSTHLSAVALDPVFVAIVSVVMHTSGMIFPWKRDLSWAMFCSVERFHMSYLQIDLVETIFWTRPATPSL